jgi:tetratricopeptide (TPR) repeat protein
MSALAPDAPSAPRAPSRFLGRVERWIATHPGLVAVAILAYALGLRFVHWNEFRHSLLAQVPLLDEAYYRDEAWSIARGAPPAADAFFMTPLYPYFLSVVFRFLGDGAATVAGVQLGLGALAGPLLFLAARAVVRPALALAAGAALGSYAPLLFYESLLLVEGLVLLALVAALFLALAVRPRGWVAALAGVALGVAVLGRGSNLALVPVFAVWMARGGGRRRGAARAALVLAGVAVVLAPLVIRNVTRTGRLLLLTANVGLNAYIGNGPEATGVFAHIPGLDPQLDALTPRYVQRHVGHPVTVVEASDWWMERTRAWVREHPGRTVNLFGLKLLLFWNRLAIPQVESFDAETPGTALAGPLFWRHPLFLPLGLLGVALAWNPFGRARRPEPARARSFVAAATVAYAVSIALFFVTDRYRIPATPFLVLLAAAAVETILAAFAPGRRRWLPALALVATTAFALTDPTRLHIDTRRLERDLHVHRALRLAAIGQLEQAVDEYRAALGLDPHDPDVRDGMARMLARAGSDSLALDEFRALLSRHPEDARAWYNLGNLYRRLGRPRPAADAYRRALQLEPRREAAWNQLGQIARERGDTAQAAQCWRQALEVVPGYAQALNNLAALRASQGHVADAERGFRAALASDPRYLPALVNLGILLTNSGRTEEARRIWKAALAVDPDHAGARSGLAAVDPEAAAALDRAPRRRPTRVHTPED